MPAVAGSYVIARNNKDGTLPYLIPLPSKEILYEQTGSSLPAQTKDGVQRAMKLQVSHPDDNVDQQSVVFLFGTSTMLFSLP